MTTRCIVAVDVMGGDFGPRVTVPASLLSLLRHPSLSLLLVGDQDQIQPHLKRCTPEQLSRIELLHTPESIRMDARPSSAIRHGLKSSMALALKAVKEGRADACVSAGNTGALMALGRLILSTLPGIDRPAIITSVPTQSGHCYLLDLGANVDCSAEHLYQFAVMGSVMVQAVEAISAPRVALLNIGVEEVKGNEQVKMAARLIIDRGAVNYIGYVEGDGLYAGRADVVVCDGFVGNIALKTSEGLARLISGKVAAELSNSFSSRLFAWLAKPALMRLQAQLDPSRRNGAALLGLQGIVVKSHGGASRECYGYALDQAVASIERDLTERIRERVCRLVGE